jgi:parvulin-like peptidyl-prolyl isomerase
MNRTLILAFCAFISFNVATAAAAEPAQKQPTPTATKPAATQPAATKPEATKPEAAKPEAAKPGAAKAEAAKPMEETSVLLNVPLFSPLFKGVPIASVDDEVIPLEELNETLFSLHESSKEGETAPKIDYKATLDRLINMTLINMEAKEMGLDQDPDIKDQIDTYADGLLRGMLKDRQTKDIIPDKDLVERFYKEAAKEWKIKSVIFTKEEDAKKMAADLKGGKDFNELVKKALADKTAKGGEPGQYMKVDKLLPQIAAQVVNLKAGAVTPVIEVPDGFTIVKVEDIRYPEGDEGARKDAEKRAVNQKANVVLKNYFDGLKKKYAVKVNQKLFKSLNYETTPAKLKKLFNDKRTLLKIKGEKPITVGQYTDVLNAKFYHGIERAITEKKVNVQKGDVLNEILARVLFLKEAKAQGIDKTEEYKNSLERYKRAVIFGVFIQKVVVPDIKITEGENKKYYEDHIADYTTPEMVKLYSLGFYKVKDAAATLKKLQQGDDFGWLKSNAPGQIKEGGDFLFDGDVFTVTGLDEGLKKVLTGTKAGDYRLFSSGKLSYVINVREEIPPQKQSYLEAREACAKKVYDIKMNQSVQDWTDKLRKAYKVKVYITGLSTTTE